MKVLDMKIFSIFLIAFFCIFINLNNVLASDASSKRLLEAINTKQDAELQAAITQVENIINTLANRLKRLEDCNQQLKFWNGTGCQNSGAPVAPGG